MGDEAAIGQGGSAHDWDDGGKLLVAVTPAGVMTGLLLAPCQPRRALGGRGLLGLASGAHGGALWPSRLTPVPPPWRGPVGPTGPRWPRQGGGAASAGPSVADRGCQGAWWQAHGQQDSGAGGLTPDGSRGRAARVRRWRQASWRQVVETVNAQRTAVFGLPFPGARSS